MVNFKECNCKFGIYLPFGWVQPLSWCFWAFWRRKSEPLLTCTRDLEATGIVSEAELLQDEKLGLDPRFCATTQSKLFHFLLADAHAWRYPRKNIVTGSRGALSGIGVSSRPSWYSSHGVMNWFLFQPALGSLGAIFLELLLWGS